MKKLLAVVLVLALCIGLGAPTALAANTEYVGTRYQVVRTLWEAAGRPDTDVKMPFLDISTKDMNIYNAVRWAYAAGITDGVDTYRFGLYDALTREMLAAFLYRYAQYRGDADLSGVDLSQYPDSVQVEEYAVAPLAWALKTGCLQPIDGCIAPKETMSERDTLRAVWTVADHQVYGEDLVPPEYDLELMQELLDGVDDAAAQGWDAVRELYEKALDQYARCGTAGTLSYMLYCLTPDDELYDKYTQTSLDGTDMGDLIQQVVCAILNTEYEDTFVEYFGNENVRYLKDYEAMSEEEKELNRQIKVWQEQYDKVYAGDYSDCVVTIRGVDWTYDSLFEAYYADPYFQNYSQAEYQSILDRIVKKIYGTWYNCLNESAKLRNQIAELHGYDNYYDYEWEEGYGRNYTYEDFLQVVDWVIQYLQPYQNRVKGAAGDLDDATETLDLSDYYEKLASCGVLPDHIREAALFLDEYRLFRVGDADSYSAGFASGLNYYHVPVIYSGYSTPSGLETLLHEFGHFNNFYRIRGSSALRNAFSDLEVSETQSQGMELLYNEALAAAYPKYAHAALASAINGIIETLVQQAMFTECERMLYEHPEYGFNKAVKEATVIAQKYGRNTDSFMEWTSIYHLQEVPGYVVSYVMSAASAFALYGNYLENPTAARKSFEDILSLREELDWTSMVEEFDLPVFEEDFYIRMGDYLKNFK